MPFQKNSHAPEKLSNSRGIPANLEIKGIIFILAACLLNVFVGAGFYFAYRSDPTYSPAAAVFLRILANFSFIFPLLLRGSRLPRPLKWRGNRALWLWGVFGALSTSTYFLSLSYSSAGSVNFLNAGSGVFVAGLSPLITGQPTPISHWFGIFGGMFGLYLLGSPSGPTFLGTILAIASGLFGGLGVLLVARTRSAYRPETVMLHWSIVCTISYLIYFFLSPPSWPTATATWILLISSGIAAAVSQYFTAKAYQLSPATLIACLSYIGPLLSFLLDMILFQLRYTPSAMLGASIILLFGGALPLLSLKQKKQ